MPSKEFNVNDCTISPIIHHSESCKAKQYPNSWLLIRRLQNFRLSDKKAHQTKPSTNHTANNNLNQNKDKKPVPQSNLKRLSAFI
jgi:hypothetical protein